MLYTHAGPEIAVASTKAYSVQMAAMYLIGCRLGLVKGIYSEEQAKEFISKLLGTIPVIEETLLQADEVKTVANYIKWLRMHSLSEGAWIILFHWRGL